MPGRYSFDRSWRQRSRSAWRPHLVVCAGLLMATSWCSGIPAVADSPPATASSLLTIRIEGLPSGMKGDIEVKGPDGYDATVTNAGPVRGISPGRYTLIAAPVKETHVTYWASPADGTKPWQTSVDVSDGSPQSVTVNYFDEISNAVHVVPGDATQAFSPDGKNDELSVVPSLAGDTYKEHEVLASEPTPTAPDGYLVSVRKVEEDDTNVERLEVAPVAIESAIPEAKVDEHFALSVDNLIFDSKSISCGSHGAISVSAQLRIAPSFTLKAEWKRLKPRSAELYAALDEYGSAELSTDSKLDCTLHVDNLVPAVPLAPHGAVIFFIGPVPVVVAASLGLAAEGTVSVHGEFRAYAEQRGELRADVFYASGHGFNKDMFGPTFSAPDGKVTVGVKAETKVALKPELRLRLYGLVGPTVGVRLEAIANAAPGERKISFCPVLFGQLYLPRLKAPTLQKELTCVDIRRWLS
jgi:hypothetical protein